MTTVQLITREANLSLRTRLQALALVEFGIPPGQASHITKISVKTIQRLRRQARTRGFDPAVSPILKLEYVEDAPRSGRPPKLNPELEDTIVASFVGEGKKEGDEKVTKAQVAEATGVSTTTVRRVLASRGVVFEHKPGSHAVEDGHWKMLPKRSRAPKGKGKEGQAQDLHVQDASILTANTDTQMGDPTMNPMDEFRGTLDPLLSAEVSPGVVL